MGVPSFFRWIVSKYPNVAVTAKKPKDPTEESPNGAFDNLYLDMNGIIHPCFHPEDQCLPPTTFDEVFELMFECIDHLFSIVRPRKLLYLAVDGVAPRAKMNQQRSRRFKAAKDMKDANEEEERLREKFKAESKEVLAREISEVSDSNVITPGTEFMERLSKALEYYIRVRLSSDQPGWKDIKVILSDANVPGEGEHKIMSFIRAQRSSESYDPNTRHCLYGLDADLIMLALASHEVHFAILREDVLNTNLQEICIPLTEKFFSMEEFARVNSSGRSSVWKNLPKKPYQFLNIWTLREYLELEMNISDPIVTIDVERIIDDFVFLCFLTGNDFLPHIPSLEIREQAIDLLTEVYKETFNKMGGYIIDTGKLDDKHAAYLKVSRLEKFLHEVALYEEKIFLKRYELQENLQWKILRQTMENEWSENNFDDMEESTGSMTTMEKAFSEQCRISESSNTSATDIMRNTMELRQALKDAIAKKQDTFKNGDFKHDRIRLGFAGWKSRYYREKFGAETSNEVTSLQNDMVVVQKYLERLCFVLKYYYVGVPSWSWYGTYEFLHFFIAKYYPFHYAPFVSDFKSLSRFKISFQLGKPFKPFDQLMAVLPPESSAALPKGYSKLMSCEESQILKFYWPKFGTDFETDIDGKRFLWQAIVKLPFINEELLLSTTKTVENDLEVHEVKRNTFRQEKILFRKNSNALANHASFASTSDCSLTKYPIGSASDIAGWLSPDDDGHGDGFFPSPIKNMVDIEDDQAESAIFSNPDLAKNLPGLLKNVTIPEKTLTEADIARRELWHEYQGPSRHAGATSRSVTIVSASPAMQREESKDAGRGWLGRGGGTRGIDEMRPAGDGRGHHCAYQCRSYGGSRGIGEMRPAGDGQRQCGTYQDRSYGRGRGYVTGGTGSIVEMRPAGDGRVHRGAYQCRSYGGSRGIAEMRPAGDGQRQYGAYQGRSHGIGRGYVAGSRNDQPYRPVGGAFYGQRTEWRPAGSQPAAGAGNEGRGHGWYRSQ